MNWLYEKLQEHARLVPSKPAVSEYLGKGKFRLLTRGELAQLATSFAESFRTSTEAETIIPIYLERTAACVAAILGALAAGRGFACINRKYRAPQVERILQLLRCPFVVSDASGLINLKARLEENCQLTSTAWRLVAGAEVHPSQAKVLATLGKRLNLAELELDSGATVRNTSSEDRGSPIGCCLFTSGSTGEPKGVLIHRNDLRDRAVAEADWYNLSEDDVLLNLLPFSFDVGLNQLLSAIWSGCELVLLNSWMPADILRVCEARDVTGISSVPPIWSDQIASGVVIQPRPGARKLRYVTISGGALDPEALERLPEVVPGAGIYKTYGQSETFRSSSLHPDEYAAKITSVGRCFTGARFYLVDEGGRQCKPNEEGQIVHTGLGTMEGYLNSGDEARKLRPNPFFGPGDPSLKAVYTGDYGYVDADGFLYVRGRKDEMVKIQGNRVYPNEIALQIMQVHAITTAEVVAVEPAKGITKLVAYVCLRPGAATTAELIQQELRNRLPSYMLPSRVEICPVLPKTANGKIDRRLLAERAAEICWAADMASPVGT